MGTQYVECSAKQNDGVDQVFKLAVQLAVGKEEVKKKRIRNCTIL